MFIFNADSRRAGTRLLLAMLGALLLVILLESTSLGQSSRRKSGAGSLITVESWQFKAACVVLAFLGAGFVSFFFVFRMLLTRRNPVWPLTAYGICLWLTCTVSFAVGLWLFWADLGGATGGSVNWLTIHWKRLVVAGVWVFVSLIIRAVFYSNGGRVAVST
jgi:hypothetical protein